jgi:hypothetical protein
MYLVGCFNASPFPVRLFFFFFVLISKFSTQTMTRFLADQTNTHPPSTSSSPKKYTRDELEAQFMRLYREMCAKEEEEEDTPPAGVDSPEDVNDDFGQKHHRFLVGKDDKEDKQLRAKTSYVMDVSTLEENERVKLARVREQQRKDQQRKDFEIQRLKRTVKMLCEQQQRQKGNNNNDDDNAGSESDRRNRRKGIDAESVDVLTEYDAELKSREIIIAELREALSETKRNANARTIERKPTSASSSTKLTLNCNTSDEREEILFLRRELRKSENAREKDSAKHLDLALREKRVALREKATNTRDKRLELLEFERAKILERAKVAETNVALLTSSLEKVEKQNQKYLEQLRASRKRDVVADRYTNRAYYY